MSESILVAVISGLCTLAGSGLGVVASNRLTRYRLRQLEIKVDKHNQVVERTFRLEGRMTEAEHDIRDLRKERST